LATLFGANAVEDFATGKETKTNSPPQPLIAKLWTKTTAGLVAHQNLKSQVLSAAVPRRGRCGYGVFSIVIGAFGHCGQWLAHVRAYLNFDKCGHRSPTAVVTPRAWGKWLVTTRHFRRCFRLTLMSNSIPTGDRRPGLSLPVKLRWRFVLGTCLVAPFGWGLELSGGTVFLSNA